MLDRVFCTVYSGFMSKLFGKRYLEMHQDIDVEELKKAEFEIPVRIRYVKGKKKFHIKCLDVPVYLYNRAVEQADFMIDEEFLLSRRFFCIDKGFGDDAIFDSLTHYAYIQETEIGNAEIYDDEYYNICFFQLFYYFTPTIVREIVKAAHLNRLGRKPTAWIELTRYTYEKHGGRPAGSGNQLSPEEHERILDNLSRWDGICQKYISKGIEDRFVECLFEFGKLPLEELPSCLRRPFLKNKYHIRWYYYALRFNYKLSIGVPEESIKPGRKKIRGKIVTYGLPCNI